MRWPREVHEGDVSCHTSSNTTLLGAETWKEFPLHRRVRAAAAADLLREVSIVESDRLKTLVQEPDGEVLSLGLRLIRKKYR